MSDTPQELNQEKKKLTSWKKEPSILELKQDLTDASVDHQQQKTSIDTWLDNLNVSGEAKVNTPKGNSKVVPRLIRKQAEWRYGALSEPFLSTDDIFNVSPVTWEDREGAIQNQYVLNHQFNHKIDKIAFIDEYVRTAVDEGTVIVRIGWDFEEEEVEVEVPEIEFSVNPAMAETHAQLAQMREQAPEQYEQEVPDELKQAHELSVEYNQPIEAVVIGSKMEKQTRTVKNQPTLEVCDYRNVVIDPTCKGDIDKAGFVIYSFESSLSALEKDGKYKNLENINVDTNSILSEPDHYPSNAGKTFNFADKARKKFVVYEYWGYWDINGTGLLHPIVATWVGNTLIRMEENPFPDKKLPFVIVPYLPVRRSVYGEPDGALLEENQKIIGAVTRGMIDIMGKSANGQTGIRKDALDLTNKRKFEKGQDYEFNANIDPRQAVYMHTYPEIPQSAQLMLQMQNMEAESLTGVKAFANTGLSGAGLGNVATAVRGVLDAASKRELGILRRLSNGMIKIARKFISMNAEFLSEEEVIRVTESEFVKIRRDDLAGEYDLRLTISTAEEDDSKAQQLAFMLQTMGNNMDPSMSQMILGDIARLRKMPDLAKKIEEYQPQPDPMAQRRAELEMALLEAQVMTEQAKAQKLNAESELAGVKMGTEDAKAGNLRSATDKTNLDYVEQESGVKQERDLQKQGEQARSQAGLKLLDLMAKGQQPDSF